MSDLKDQIREQQEAARMTEFDRPGPTAEDAVSAIPSTARRTSKGALVTYGVGFAIIIAGVLLLKHELDAYLTAPKKNTQATATQAFGLPPLQIPPAPVEPATATTGALMKPPAPTEGALGTALNGQKGPVQITLAQRRMYDMLMVSGQDTNANGQQPGTATAAPQSEAAASPASGPATALMPTPASFNQPAPVMVSAPAGMAVPAPPGAQQAGSNSKNGLAGNLQPTELALATARVLPNRNYIITKGTSLDCALVTAIDTTLPSLTTCTLTRNVYSDNGNVILLDRGSKLVGEFRSGVEQGQARVFVLWDRIETPTGVIINIASPGADRLGRGGNTGYVDNHFWQRFGGAILMSFVSDTTAALVNRETSNNSPGSATVNTFAYGNTVNSGQSVVASMLQQSVNIPPTIRINQGTHVEVMVARDLSFASVYKLQASNAH